MRRAVLVLVALVVAGVLAAPAAQAHPLGNFTINHLTRVSVDDDAVQLHYVLDEAEIPTFQARGLSHAEVVRRARAEVARGLTVSVDGRRAAVVPVAAPRLSFPQGQGGLRLTRVEMTLRVAADAPRRVEVGDRTYAGRIGYTAVVAEPGDGTAVRSSTSSEDPTDGLRRYPAATVQRPLAQRASTLTVEPGSGTLVAPRYEGGKAVTTRNGGGDGFAGVFEDAAAGEGTLLFLLLAALGWGALHALSPGHGKAMVAAYLVGTRGTARHAIALGAVVTVTHTIGVFALGLVTLVAAQYILPEDLFPWLTLVSGLMVVAIGGAVLRSRLRVHRARHAHGDHTHDHHHDHAHDHHHHHHDDGHTHGHGHHHHLPEEITWKGLLGMGASAGLIPCPSALVVLLGAISQHQVALGLLLIVVFSVGLAVTLTVLGLLVVNARRVTASLRVPPAVATALPAASALVIVALGCVLTLQAAPQLL